MGKSSAGQVELSWSSNQRFDARDDAGHGVILDGDMQEGFSPTQALLSSTAACMGIDVVVILEKMRTELTGLRISIEGDRMEEPPRYFHRLRLHFEVKGNVPRDRAERAIRLSFERYCSVFHTLRKDIDIETTVEVDAVTLPLLLSGAADSAPL